MNWISVKDKLPDFSQNVLTYNVWTTKDGKEYRDIEVSFIESITMGHNYKNVHWQTFAESRSISPSHWMPLPEPPK